MKRSSTKKTEEQPPHGGRAAEQHSLPASSWREHHYAFLDLEGSGAQDRDKEDILEIAVVGASQEPKDWFHSLVRPRRPVRRFPWIPHHLTDEALEHAPPFGDIAMELRDALESKVVVGHNVQVDWRLLSRHLHARPVAILDTLRMARASAPELSSHKLEFLLRHFNLNERLEKLTEAKPHQALFDALACRELFFMLLNTFHATIRPLEELNNLYGVTFQTGSSSNRDNITEE